MILIIIVMMFIAIKISTYKAWIKDIEIRQNRSFNKIAKLKWNLVKNIYNINPKRFRIDTVEYRGKFTYDPLILYNSNQQDKILRYNYKTDLDYNTITIRTKAEDDWDNGDIFCIKLSLIDFYKFLHWIKQNEKNKQKETINNNIKQFLESAQKDIDKLAATAQSQLEEANNMMKKATKGGTA